MTDTSTRDRGAVLVLAIVLVAIILLAAVHAPEKSIGITLFERFQTIIAAFVALGGAWLGAKAIYRQITLTERLANERRAGQKAAARAVLPLALSAISHYAEDCAECLRNLIDECEDGVLPNQGIVPDFPTLPISAIDTFKELAEHSTAVEREPIARLVAKIQVQRSRLTSIIRRRPESIVSSQNLFVYLRDCAEIYARSAAMFDYARLANVQMPSAVIQKEQIASALRNLGVFDEQHDEVMVLVPDTIA